MTHKKRPSSDTKRTPSRAPLQPQKALRSTNRPTQAVVSSLTASTSRLDACVQRGLEISELLRKVVSFCGHTLQFFSQQLRLNVWENNERR